MKLDPGFLNHWKTERLIEQLGADGIVAVLRLWGNAQIRRQYSGLSLTPRRLAMETKWKGDENHLFSVLTDPDSPWLDAEEGGTWAIHGFAEHQHQVVKLWQNGRKGGRPTKEKEDKNIVPSSSSYPICKPNGNHMVLNESEGADFSDSMPREAARNMHALFAHIQAMKPAWKLPPTYAEMQSLMHCAATVEAMTPEDWQTVKDYMHARIPEGEPAWQPRGRAKFIETLPDVYDHATRWARKQQQRKPAPPKPALKNAQDALSIEEMRAILQQPAKP